MSNEIKAEIGAIEAILLALEPLAPDNRLNVLTYVGKHFKIAVGVGADLTPPPDKPSNPQPPGSPSLPVHIKEFKVQKDPKSANEMSAIVAYYLANIAPQPQRKDRITAKDIETFFKIADFPLVKKVDMALVNAKAAGYFDSVGNGEYKLNAVGHNLVVHNLPRGGQTARRNRRQTNRTRPATQPRGK